MEIQSPFNKSFHELMHMSRFPGSAGQRKNNVENKLHRLLILSLDSDLESRAEDSDLSRTRLGLEIDILAPN